MTVYEQIQAFLKEWPDAEWGPAHVILSDYNLDNGFINGGIRDVDAWENSTGGIQHSDEELKATKAFLEKLLEIPEDERDVDEDDY